MADPTLRELVAAFRKMLEEGRVVEAMERFYADDVCVFENRTLARAGREKCVEHERKQLRTQPAPLRFKFRSVAVDEASGVAFLEYVLRFSGPEGRPMRLEEVSVQEWRGGRIAEERFYYEGVVDEGD